MIVISVAELVDFNFFEFVLFIFGVFAVLAESFGKYPYVSSLLVSF